MAASSEHEFEGRVSGELAKSLTQLFNYSLRTGEIPEEWKAANVTPVFKKGRSQQL